MSNSAKLVLSWCQGVGGRSEFGAACQGAGGSLNMWSTMLTRQSTYHLPPVWRALRPSHQPAPHAQLRQVSVELASGGWRPQLGWYSGPRCQWFPGHVVNDADTWGSYHLPPISWEPRPSPKCAALWCWIEVFESGMGLRVLSGRVRRENAWLTLSTCCR